VKYPFLDNNEFILIDYLPGSSGQLLLRLWSELDKKINYHNEEILSSYTINKHPASREVNYNISVPKRYVNWFYDKCLPQSLEEQLTFYELLGTQLVAQQQKWNWNNKQAKFFYPNKEYELKNNRVLYGMHLWNYDISFLELSNKKPNLKFISLIPQTPQGIAYQVKRGIICYPEIKDLNQISYNFNNHSRHYNKFDFLTYLVDKEFSVILDWLKDNIGESYMKEQENTCIKILDTYYNEVVSNV